MTDDDTFAKLDELTEKYNDVLDQLQEARGAGRPDLQDKARDLMAERIEEGARLHRAGVSYADLEAHLEATDRYRHGM